MWQLIKGDTCTKPLLGYEDVRDLGMILVTNLMATEGNQPEGTGNLKKYKDQFQGTGKLKGIQVDLTPILSQLHSHHADSHSVHVRRWKRKCKISLKKLMNLQDGFTTSGYAQERSEPGTSER